MKGKLWQCRRRPHAQQLPPIDANTETGWTSRRQYCSSPFVFIEKSSRVECLTRTTHPRIRLLWCTRTACTGFWSPYRWIETMLEIVIFMIVRRNSGSYNAYIHVFKRAHLCSLCRYLDWTVKWEKGLAHQPVVECGAWCRRRRRWPWSGEVCGRWEREDERHFFVC